SSQLLRSLLLIRSSAERGHRTAAIMPRNAIPPCCAHMRKVHSGAFESLRRAQPPRSIPMPPKQADPVLVKLPGLLPELEALYTDLHAHPELSMQETRTAGLAADRLRAAGYEVTTGVGNTGVVGLLRNGAGPTVMLRADMDALPVEEATGVPYASKVKATDREGKTVPVMHACGHDMHVTWLVGAAALMAGGRDAWHGTLMAVFQPAEETAAGARAMIDDGLFRRFPKPEII